MWCIVYVLYISAARLPSEAAKSEKRYGWLSMHSKLPKKKPTWAPDRNQQSKAI